MARITSRQAQEMMDAYAKVYENKEEPTVETPVNETPVEDIQEQERPRSSAIQNYLKRKEGEADLNAKADEWKKKNPNKKLNLGNIINLIIHLIIRHQ